MLKSKKRKEKKMGVFSWLAQDTDESIPAQGNSQNRPCSKISMWDNKGNKWDETEYEGYGVFGGKDFYELLAEMNGMETRSDGIDLAFSGKPYLSPNLASDKYWTWIDEAPKTCPDQGYFYCYDEDEEDYDDESLDY